MATQASAKPRVVVLTDIENEPDDAMSLVRFLSLPPASGDAALLVTLNRRHLLYQADFAFTPSAKS